MAAMPAMASPSHYCDYELPEAPAACAMGFRVRGTQIRLRTPGGRRSLLYGLADA